MSQNSILLEKSLHFSVRIVKLHRLLHRHEDDLSAELLKHFTMRWMAAVASLFLLRGG